MSWIFNISSGNIKRIQSSIILALYMSLCFSFHFASRELKPVITSSIMLISFLALFLQRMDKLKIYYNFKIVILWIGFILLAFIIKVINFTVHPTVLYLLSAPAFAYFLIENKFDMRIIYIPILVVSSYFMYYILSGQDFNKIFPHTSRNYISVLMITNAALINLIEWRQFRKISVWPALLTLFFSLYAIGRAGIICSALFSLGTLYCRFERLSNLKKIINVLIIIIPIVLLIAIFFNSIIDVASGMKVLNRFFARGIVDATRDNLIQNYISNIDLKTFLLGYNYDNDPLFQKYLLNPHNSYIRLHYQLGIFFFPIIFLLIRTLFRFFSRNKLYFAILLTFLLRGWTDSVFFLGEYDFLIITLILLSSKFYGSDSKVDLQNSD